MTKNEIVERIGALPKGSITMKKIRKPNGKMYEYYFLQWTEDGKQKTRSVRADEIETIKLQIEERKRLERKLSLGEYDAETAPLAFHTNVSIGKELQILVKPVENFKKRDGFGSIKDYIYGNYSGKVFILYGLRRTGKTTLIHQVIRDMKPDDLCKTAFMQMTRQDTFANFNKDLKLLQANGYQYVFVDEVTFMADFIEGAALLSDIYATSGMKIILSGTDSLGFWITKGNELYDRSIFLHTTFIPYREFSGVLGINGIDSYIQYGGTMSISGHHYNVFDSKESTDEYIDSSIAQNIQHSLKYYQYEGHFRHLYDLYQKGELTGAINRVVEDINHRFAIDVLEREFKSHDLGVSANNLRKDREYPTTILDDIDITAFTSRLKDMLSIKNKEEQSIAIDNIHIRQIEEYLRALDLIYSIDIMDDDTDKPDLNRVVFTQPGLRYSQAKSFILSLSEDQLFRKLSIEEQERVIDRILNEIKGRMAEDIILLETKLAKPEMKVFKLQFSNGEFDMVIANPKTLESEIYEIKYSKEAVIGQARHLLDDEKCIRTERRFGKITKKSVLYRGDDVVLNGIQYKNIEEYLNEL